MEDDALAEADVPVALVDGQNNGDLFVEHRRDRDIARDDVIAGGAGLVVAPLVELITFGRDGCDRDRLAGLHILERKLRNAALVAALERARVGVLDLVAGGELARRGRRRRPGCGRGGGLLGAHGDIVGIGAAVVRLPGVGRGVVEHRARTGGVVAVALKIGRVGKAGVCLEDLGAVEELVAVLVADDRQLLVDLVDQRLARSGALAGFRHRRQRVDDQIAVRVGGRKRAQHVAVVHDEAVDGRAVQIGAAQRDDGAAGLHFGKRLGHGVGVRVLGKADAGALQDIADGQAVGAQVLVQRDLAGGVQRVCIRPAHKHGRGQVAAVGSRGGQNAAQRGIDRVLVRVIVAGPAAAAAEQTRQQHPGEHGAEDDGQHAQNKHDTGAALGGAERAHTGIVAAHSLGIPPFVSIAPCPLAGYGGSVLRSPLPEKAGGRLPAPPGCRSRTAPRRRADRRRPRPAGRPAGRRP